MELEKEIKELIKYGTVQQRIELLNKICLMKEKALEQLNVLIEFLDDDWDNYRRGSAFGPTGIDPDTDLEIAIKARDFLYSLGDEVAPALICELEGYITERKHYYAVQILGFLKSRAAIPIFKKLMLKNDTLSVRVNFDQSDILNISKAAFKAFMNTDKVECKNFIRSVIDENYFIEYPEHRIFNYYNISYKELWKNSFIKFLDETE